MNIELSMSPMMIAVCVLLYLVGMVFSLLVAMGIEESVNNEMSPPTAARFIIMWPIAWICGIFILLGNIFAKIFILFVDTDREIIS